MRSVYQLRVCNAFRVITGERRNDSYRFSGTRGALFLSEKKKKTLQMNCTGDGTNSQIIPRRAAVLIH